MNQWKYPGKEVIIKQAEARQTCVTQTQSLIQRQGKAILRKVGFLSFSPWGAQHIPELRERRFSYLNYSLLCNKLSQNLVALKSNLSFSFMVL